MNRVFLFLLMLSVPNVGLTGVFLFDRGELKVTVNVGGNQSVERTTVRLISDFMPILFTTVDPDGVAYLTQVPCGFYTLSVFNDDIGEIRYRVYIESGVLKAMNCHLYNGPQCFYKGTRIRFIRFDKMPILGSVYGNTSVYTTDRILTSPY